MTYNIFSTDLFIVSLATEAAFLAGKFPVIAPAVVAHAT
jgi:hypothetical protein